MKPRILVVDDEEIMRRSLADILKLEGYQVQTLSNGAAAIDALSGSAFDLMIVDLKMSGVDGLEVMKAASRLAPDMLVILLTAHGSLESAVEALRQEAFDYLLKPSSPEQILRSVRAALQRRSESLRKRSIIDQLDTSLRELMNSERRESFVPPAGKPLVLPGGVSFDLHRRELWSGDLKVLLTTSECKLFNALMENRGKVLSHQQLVRLVQGYEMKEWEAPEMLRPLVSRLRQKLSQLPGGKDWISNVRGAGYVLEFEE